MKGAYILLIRLDSGGRIRIGKMGPVYFPKGYYAYVGSAMNGLPQRIMRHLKGEKKMHWHIDYLLRKGRIVEIYCFQSGQKEECVIASRYGKRFFFGSGIRMWRL